MNIFKALFGTKEQSSEEKKKETSAKQFDVLKYDGVRALRSNQPAYAVQCLTKALEMEDDLECRDYLSQALMQTGELAAAYEQLGKMAAAEPENQQIFIRMASVSFMLENYVAMTNDCEKALLIDESNAQVYLLYARACRGEGDDANAEAMASRAISLKDDYFEAYLLRGEIRLSLGNVDEAAQDCDVLLSRLEDNEDVLLLAARIDVGRKDYQAAVKGYDKVLEVDPFSIAALRERAAAKYSLGLTDEAESDLKEAAEIEAKSNPEAAGQSQNVEQQVKQIYKNIDPYGIFS